MKNTIVNKFQIVLTLWMSAIIGVLTFIGYKTDLSAFLIVAIILAAIVLVCNALFFSLQIRKAWHIQPSQKENLYR